jgi:hypothetical protein
MRSLLTVQKRYPVSCGKSSVGEVNVRVKGRRDAGVTLKRFVEQPDEVRTFEKRRFVVCVDTFDERRSLREREEGVRKDIAVAVMRMGSNLPPCLPP